MESYNLIYPRLKKENLLKLWVLISEDLMHNFCICIVFMVHMENMLLLQAPAPTNYLYIQFLPSVQCKTLTPLKLLTRCSYLDFRVKQSAV